MPINFTAACKRNQDQNVTLSLKNFTCNLMDSSVFPLLTFVLNIKDDN